MNSIDGIRNIINQQFNQIAPITPQRTENTTSTTSGKANFADMLGNAMQEVTSLQNDANQKIEGVTLGGEGVNTHNAMVALEKADVAFQLMSAVRTKIIRAYEEVMRTPV